MIFIDARGFSKSNGALIALFEHYSLIKKAKRETKLIVDKNTKIAINSLQLENNDILVINNPVSYFILLIFALIKTKNTTIFCPHALSFAKNFILLPFIKSIYLSLIHI